MRTLQSFVMDRELRKPGKTEALLPTNGHRLSRAAGCRPAS
jgi:hypothetical protein